MDIKQISIVGQIMMYGTLVLSLYKTDIGDYYIDVDSAPDGYSMEENAHQLVDVNIFEGLVSNIMTSLTSKPEGNDQGCSGCCVEIVCSNGKEVSYDWPKDLHTETYRTIVKFVNEVIDNDVVGDFIEMF